MTTFAQLKSRIINILINALQVEADAQNTHMLLGGLLLCVQDSAIFEDSDNNNEQYHSSPAPSDMNLLSSGKFTVLLILNILIFHSSIWIALFSWRQNASLRL